MIGYVKDDKVLMSLGDIKRNVIIKREIRQIYYNSDELDVDYIEVEYLKWCKDYTTSIKTYSYAKCDSEYVASEQDIDRYLSIGENVYSQKAITFKV